MDDKAVIESFEKSWGQRMAILAFGVLVVSALVAALFVGFRGRHIPQNAKAMIEGTTPAIPAPTKPGDKPAH